MPTALGLDRVACFVALGLVAALNGLAANIVMAVSQHGLAGGLLGGLNVNPIVWFALCACLAIAFAPTSDGEPGAGSGLRRGDAPVFALAALLVLIPIATAASLAVVLIGVWLAYTCPAGSPGRRVAVVLLALSTTLLWGWLVLMAFGRQLLELDGQFVAWLAGTSATGNLVDFSQAGMPMAIGYPCSSMHNLTRAILLWAAMTQLLRIPLSPRSALLCVAAVAATVAINGARLATIALHRDSFDYWHLGEGGGMFAWAAVLTAMIIVTGGCFALAPRRV